MKFPQRIVIELTPRCNLSCSMCPRHYIKVKNGDMSRKLWKKLIDEISEVSADSIIIPFWRGESLLHPDFTELMGYALSKSLRIHTSTNGHVLTREQAAVLERCEFVTFSIHSTKGYTSARDFLSNKRDGRPIVQISFVKGEKTTEKLLGELINSHDLRGFDSVRLYEEHSKGGVFGKSSYTLKTHRIFCPKLEDTLVIAYDGSVSRCNHVWVTEKGIDLNKMSIEKAWGSNYLNEIRNEYPDEHCSSCDQWIGHTCGESWRLVNGKVEHKVFSVTDQ